MPEGDPVDASYNNASYVEQQRLRVETLREKISNRPLVVRDGRVMPSDGDLPIGIGRRLEAAVMFIDICGFSGRPSNTLDEQEGLLRALGFFFTELIRVIEDYGGTVEKNTGDGLMAYFPADSQYSDHESQRALAAAMSCFYAADRFINPVIQASRLPAIDFRVCVDHGTITVANVGAPKRFKSFVAIGATANFACKLLSLAGKNEILIGASVLPGLPLEWRRDLCFRLGKDTGWTVGPNKDPYTAYIFDGRWNGAR